MKIEEDRLNRGKEESAQEHEKYIGQRALDNSRPDLGQKRVQILETKNALEEEERRVSVQERKNLAELLDALVNWLRYQFCSDHLPLRCHIAIKSWGLAAKGHLNFSTVSETHLNILRKYSGLVRESNLYLPRFQHSGNSWLVHICLTSL